MRGRQRRPSGGERAQRSLRVGGDHQLGHRVRRPQQAGRLHQDIRVQKLDLAKLKLPIVIYILVLVHSYYISTSVIQTLQHTQIMYRLMCVPPQLQPLPSDHPVSYVVELFIRIILFDRVIVSITRIILLQLPYILIKYTHVLYSKIAALDFVVIRIRTRKTIQENFHWRTLSGFFCQKRSDITL